MSDRFLSLREVQLRVPFTRRWISVLEERGEFPRRVRLGRRRVAWAQSEVDEWCARRLAEREVPAAAA